MTEPTTNQTAVAAQPIRVGVLGARGRMGSEVCRTVDAAPDTDLVAMVDQGISAVVGTSGFDPERIETVRGWLDQRPDVGVIIVPNFAIGAVLMMQFAQKAAKYFESAEI